MDEEKLTIEEEKTLERAMALVELLQRQGMSKEEQKIIGLYCLEDEELLKKMLIWVYDNHPTTEEIWEKLKEETKDYPEAIIED